MYIITLPVITCHADADTVTYCSEEEPAPHTVHVQHNRRARLAAGCPIDTIQ